MTQFGFLYIAGFLVILGLFWVIVARGGGALWIIQVREGVLEVKRGQPPPRLMEDFADALRGVDRLVLRGFRVDDHVELEIRGDVDAGTQQRLRNIVGIHYR